MSDYFPDIDTDALVLMVELQRQDPEYILRGGFPEEIEALFLALNGQARPEKVKEQPLEELSKWEKLEQESEDLFRSLTEAGKTLDSRDNAEKMAYFRTATTLLERIVGLQERATNLKQLAQFQQTVLSIMDDVLDGDQRMAVRSRLEEAMRAD